MNANAYATSEKKDRKRGMFISFLLHLSIIAIALFPFLNNNPFQQPEEQTEMILVDFTDFKPASKEGAKPTKKSAEKDQKKSVKKAVPKAKPVPKPKPEPVKPKKPVLTAPVPEIPIKTSPTKDKAPKEAPMEKPTPEVVTPEAPVEVDAEESESDASDSKASSSSSEATSSSDGGNGTGKQGDGTHHTGTNWGEMAGDGIFNRKVIYRADVKKITRQEGKIVVNLCINRDGRVVMAKAEKDECTIKDNSIIRKAVDLTTKYRFARDTSAPYKQCGKLTYIFEY